MSKRENKNKLMTSAKKHLKPLKFEEFKCPLCKGVASVSCKFGVIRAECHACGTWAEERDGR